jgi:ammonium transporter, Amt family
MTANLLVLLSVLGLLFPLGAVLWSAGANRDPEAPPAGFYVLAAAALGVIGSLITGFGLQFGGAAGLYPALGELSGLADHWTPLANVLGSGWALAGASGFFLSVGDDPGAYALFVFQVSQLIAGLSVIAIACAGRVRPVRAVTFALLAVLFGWLLYPLAGSWTWGGGWLSTLGQTDALGHGLVDFGGAGAIHLAAGVVALAGALAWGRLPGPAATALPAGDPVAPLAVSPETTDRPASPLGVAGALAMGLGWLALLAGSAVLTGTSLPVVIINGLVAGAAGCAAALGYMGFTTGRSDDAMGARGLVAGLVAISAGAPFVSPAAALLIGAVAGLLVCLATHLVSQSLRLDDPLGVVSVHGVGGLWGLLVVGIFAHGHAGAGWNGVGIKEYLGMAAQGVTGLSPAGGLAADPGQMRAQLIGALAIFVLVLIPNWLLFWLARRPVSALAEEESGAPGEGQAEA